jgi:hypothetical protein
MPDRERPVDLFALHLDTQACGSISTPSRLFLIDTKISLSRDIDGR